MSRLHMSGAGKTIITSILISTSYNQTPIFARNHALSIDINDHEIEGLNATGIIGPHRIYKTAIDYIYTLTKLLFNQFDKHQYLSKCCILR